MKRGTNDMWDYRCAPGKSSGCRMAQNQVANGKASQETSQ